MRCFFALIAAAAAMLSVLPVQAQTSKSTAPVSPLWEIHLDLKKTFASPLGQHALDTFQAEEPDDFQKAVDFCEALGFDPRTDIGEVVLFGNGFDESDATLIADLGQSTGNLEGWILAAPGYRSEDLDPNTQLHSMKVEGKESRAWFAVPKHPKSSNFILIGSLDRDRTTGFARQVMAGSLIPAVSPLEGSNLFSFKIRDLSAVPIEIDGDGPGAGIVKIIEQIGLTIASDDENLSVTLDVSASSVSKARQIGQLLNGLKALGQLASADKVPKEALEALSNVIIKQNEGESKVQANAIIPYPLIEELIRSAD